MTPLPPQLHKLAAVLPTSSRDRPLSHITTLTEYPSTTFVMVALTEIASTIEPPDEIGTLGVVSIPYREADSAGVVGVAASRSSASPGVCCSVCSTNSASFAASAISMCARRKYISRVWGLRVLEACRLKHSALSLWKRTRVLSVLTVWISFPPYVMLFSTQPRRVQVHSYSFPSSTYRRLRLRK